MQTTKQNIRIELPSCSFETIFVQGGTFDMGGKERKGEQPIHSVTVPSFYMGQYPVTQELYEAVMGTNPSHFQGKYRPVENVSWNDARKFTERLKDMTKKEFRLPTEAEWEYAARGGVNSQDYTYCGSDDLKQVGWYNRNSGRETKPVGLLYPNELGLYDMSGNVEEWCEDDWYDDYSSPDRPDDGSAWVDVPKRSTSRVIRGGYCFLDPVYCRPANRDPDHPDGGDSILGFRLVFSPS